MRQWVLGWRVRSMGDKHLYRRGHHGHAISAVAETLSRLPLHRGRLARYSGRRTVRAHHDHRRYAAYRRRRTPRTHAQSSALVDGNGRRADRHVLEPGPSAREFLRNLSIVRVLYANA